MRETVNLTGMVIKSTSSGEADRRLVILTRERGKITAFARGAKRPGSALMAASRTFAFGTFRLFEGRDAYNMQGAEIINYFEEIASDMEAACYGSYFLEMADYYSRENLEGTELLKLVYQSLRALLKPAIPNPLVRRIFELKAMVIGGEYTEHPGRPVSDSANYAWEYVVFSPVESLYRFTLTDEVFRQFSRCVEEQVQRCIDKRFHSLDVLEMLSGR
ncbi:MAG: DNA repair protein RecO [Lachnospiraceae bacterium]|nr:DNA repair protein RecO [Lachnospiraceae bacterium]